MRLATVGCAMLSVIGCTRATPPDASVRVRQPASVGALDPAPHAPGLPPVLLERLSWTQVRDAIDRGHTTVIIPTGGVEANGPYVATGKHNYVVEVMAQAIARKLGNALVAPVVKFVPEGGIDPPTGHMRYAGTLSVGDAVFESLLVDLCRSLKQHGFLDIVLIGDSGGNQRGMHETAALLNAKWQGHRARAHHVPEYYSHDKWSFDTLKRLGIKQQPDVQSASRAGVHSDYHYEAILATVDPSLIQAADRIEAGAFAINGVSLLPLERTVANGKKLIEYRAALTAEAIRRTIGRP